MIATFQHLESGSLRLSEPYALSENASLNTSRLAGSNLMMTPTATNLDCQ